MFIRNYSNESTVVYKAHKNKGHKPIIEDNILPNFCGGIMGDHDTTLYSYGTKNYECNIHLGRYLEELIQNVPDIKWATDMKKLIFTGLSCRCQISSQSCSPPSSASKRSAAANIGGSPDSFFRKISLLVCRTRRFSGPYPSSYAASAVSRVSQTSKRTSAFFASSSGIQR